MSERRWQAVLFDFDYTLADSSPGIIECTNYALQKLGLPVADQDAIRLTIGKTLAASYTQLTGRVDASEQSAYARYFIARADKVMVDSTRLYSATRVVLPCLQLAGYQLGIVSTKYVDRLDGVLRRENLRQYVRVLIGGDQVERQKPAPDGLLLAARCIGVEPAKCLYVGDTPIDAQAASYAEMGFAAVLSGLSTRTDFAGVSAQVILADVGALPGWLDADEGVRTG